MFYRAGLALTAWAATAVAAVGAGLAGISAIGAGITDRTVKPMTSAQVRKALTRPAPTSPSLSPTRPGTSGKIITPRASSPPGGTRSLTSPGGNVLARCGRTLAYLVSWTPLQGYGSEKARRGPALQVSVEFESARREITMVVTCHEGRPVAAVHSERHGHHHDDHEH